MTWKKKIFLASIAAANLVGNAIAESSLSSLAQTESEIIPLACPNQDTGWYQKSGPDLVKDPQVESQTLFFQADTVNGQSKKTQIAEGNVIAYKGDQTLSSDWLIYDQAQDHATAGDNIVLTRQYDSVQGKWADYYLDLNKGTFKQARVYYNKENMTGTGQQINVLDKKHMNIEDGYFTTCNPDDPAWYIKSSKINFDYQNSQGNARNAVMYFESAPIFATPYMSFPLGQRRSGWLTPTMGGTSTSGFMFSLPYYWNIAPNYDMTITPEYWARQGFMLTDQFRYMSENNSGSMYTEQVPSSYNAGDPNANDTYRYYWSLNDLYNPMKYVTMGYNYNAVSDSNYFNDFGNFYSVTDNVNLDQSAYIQYQPNWGMANVKLQNYQSLYPYGTSATVPIYAQYPVVNFNVKPQDLGAGIKGGLASQYSNFVSSSMQNGQRSMVYPSLTYPMMSAWGFVTPKVGYNYTNYNLASNPGYPSSDTNIERGLPITSLDSGLYFDRTMSMGKGNYTQTFEPRAYYLNIPGTYQGNIPVFDTATATYNYNQLFNENRFSGYDRINMANDLTLGGTTRILNDTNGNELMNFSLGYRYFLTTENPFLYGTYTQYPQLFLPAPNTIAELNNKWSKSFSSNANFQYDSTYGNVNAYGVNLKFNPDDGKVINLGYSYQYQLPLLYYNYTPGQQFQPVSYENQYAVNLAGQWPIYENKYFAVGRANYDFTRQMLLNVIGGLEYNGGCYTISAVYEQFIFNYNQNQQNYMLNFSFKGIGSVGSGDPSQDLKFNVPGYMPVSQLPQNQIY